MQTERRLTRSVAKATKTPLTAPLEYGGKRRRAVKKADLPRAVLFNVTNTEDDELKGPREADAISQKAPQQQRSTGLSHAAGEGASSFSTPIRSELKGAADVKEEPPESANNSFKSVTAQQATQESQYCTPPDVLLSQESLISRTEICRQAGSNPVLLNSTESARKTSKIQKSRPHVTAESKRMPTSAKLSSTQYQKALDSASKKANSCKGILVEGKHRQQTSAPYAPSFKPVLPKDPLPTPKPNLQLTPAQTLTTWRQKPNLATPAVRPAPSLQSDRQPAKATTTSPSLWHRGLQPARLVVARPTPQQTKPKQSLRSLSQPRARKASLLNPPISTKRAGPLTVAPVKPSRKSVGEGKLSGLREAPTANLIQEGRPASMGRPFRGPINEDLSKPGDAVSRPPPEAGMQCSPGLPSKRDEPKQCDSLIPATEREKGATVQPSNAVKPGGQPVPVQGRAQPEGQAEAAENECSSCPDQPKVAAFPGFLAVSHLIGGPSDQQPASGCWGHLQGGGESVGSFPAVTAAQSDADSDAHLPASHLINGIVGLPVPSLQPMDFSQKMEPAMTQEPVVSPACKQALEGAFVMEIDAATSEEQCSVAVNPNLHTGDGASCLSPVIRTSQQAPAAAEAGQDIAAYKQSSTEAQAKQQCSPKAESDGWEAESIAESSKPKRLATVGSLAKQHSHSSSPREGASSSTKERKNSKSADARRRQTHQGAALEGVQNMLPTVRLTRKFAAAMKSIKQASAEAAQSAESNISPGVLANQPLQMATGLGNPAAAARMRHMSKGLQQAGKQPIRPQVQSLTRAPVRASARKSASSKKLDDTTARLRDWKI